VYKFAMDMNNYPVSFKTFDIDNGCMLVWKDNNRKNYNGRIINANWNDYLSYGHTIMNVTSTVEI